MKLRGVTFTCLNHKHMLPLISLLVIFVRIHLAEAKSLTCQTCFCYRRSGEKYVDCTYNGITELPTDIPVKTSRLLLNGNGFTSIGSMVNASVSFKYPLPNLKYLYLHNNPITEISTDAFQNVSQIERLLLHFTQITEIQDGLLSGLKNLKIFWANDARISKIGSSAFANLTELEDLKLYDNFIEKVHPGQFQDQGKMHHLDIHRNTLNATPECCQLCGIPAGLDIHWPTMNTGQQIRCGCDGPITCPNIASPCFPDNKCHVYTFNAASSIRPSIIVSGLAIVLSLLLGYMS